MLNGVQLVRDWEHDLLKLSFPQQEDNTNVRQLQSLGDLTKLLWQKFNNNRAELDRDYMSDEKMLVAYLAAFFIPNIERTRHIASSSRVKDKLIKLMNQEELEILDFGSGPLSSSIGILIALGELSSGTGSSQNKIQKIRITATERSERAFKIGALWLEKVMESRISMSIERRTSIPQDKQFDIAVASNVFNEIPEKHHLKTMLMLSKAIKQNSSSPESLLLIIEPGQEIHSKRLVALRDQVIETESLSNLHILAPCPHSFSCPLSPSVERSDWCWFRCRFEVPTFQKELDKRSQLDHSELAYSFLAYSPKANADKPWSICVSDEMGVGPLAAASKRLQYFSNNLIQNNKISDQRLEQLATDGFKTKLCCSNGKLVAGIRGHLGAEVKTMRGDEIATPSQVETLIAEG